MKPQVQVRQEKAVKQEWGPWSFGLLLHVNIFLCLQGLLGQAQRHATSIGWWSVALHAQLSGLVGQIKRTQFMMSRSRGNLVTCG